MNTIIASSSEYLILRKFRFLPNFIAMSEDETQPSGTFTLVKTHHVLLVLVIVIVLVAFHFRQRLAERFEVWRNNRRWSSLVHSGFEDDLENGFSSNNFDITENIADNDLRTLDETAKDEIRHLMQKHNLTFDDARLRYFREKMRANGVDSDGVPTDPKSVTFH